MKDVRFVKMAGAGNDFVLVDNRRGVMGGALSRTARALCDRKRGVGADGLILLERSRKADIRMRIFNSDGSQAEMCGNGVRCLAHFAASLGIGRAGRLTIETPAGVITASVRGRRVKARMVDPRGLDLDVRLRVAGRAQRWGFVDTGVPHAVRLVSSVADQDVEGLGRHVRRHARFSPKGTNVNFVAVRGPREIEVRTYERGVEGETLACGTGSTASAIVAACRRPMRSPVTVRTRGGEKLRIHFRRKGDVFHDVHLEGDVTRPFEGKVSL